MIVIHRTIHHGAYHDETTAEGPTLGTALAQLGTSSYDTRPHTVIVASLREAIDYYDEMLTDKEQEVQGTPYHEHGWVSYRVTGAEA